MAIEVACQCGKRFKAADQHAGKKARCPGCGAALTIPKPAAAFDAGDDLMSLGEPEVFQPSARTEAPAAVARKGKLKAAAAAAPPLSKSNREKGPAAVPSISISPGIIAMIVLAIVIPSAIYWAKEGPMKAQAQWAKMEGPAGDNIVGQITHAIQRKYEEYGRDMNDMAFRPKAINVVFDTQGMMLSMPETIKFQGNSTEGHFSGEFHPHTWRFEADVPLRTSPTLLKVTGSASEVDMSLEVNGTPVK